MNKFERSVMLGVMAVAVAVAVWWNWPPPAKAVQAIRAFEGNPDLRPRLVMTITRRTGGKMFAEREFYIFRQTNAPPSGQYLEWYVNMLTFEVNEARYRERSGSKPVYKPVGPRTEGQCNAIAEDYARKKYRGFGSMRFQPTRSEWVAVDTAWKFRWEHGNSSQWNRVQVTVSPVDGSIVDYNGIRDPVPGEWGYGRSTW